jgi:hypothetical protein
VVNLRALSADDACTALFNPTVTPNLPTKESQVTRPVELPAEPIPA